MSAPLGLIYASVASVVVLGIAVLSAKAYDHSGRHYAEGREPAGSSRVCALVYRYLQASSIGVALGTVLFFVGIYLAFRQKREAGANPWGSGATTLEWSLSSPPPFHCYETLPQIK